MFASNDATSEVGAGIWTVMVMLVLAGPVLQGAAELSETAVTLYVVVVCGETTRSKEALTVWGCEGISDHVTVHGWVPVSATCSVVLEPRVMVAGPVTVRMATGPAATVTLRVPAALVPQEFVAVAERVRMPVPPAVYVTLVAVVLVIVPPVIDHWYCTLPFVGTEAVFPVEPAHTGELAVITGVGGTEQVVTFWKAIEEGRAMPLEVSCR